MDLKIKNWDDMVVNDYMRLQSIVEGDYDNIDTEINIVALLAGVNEEDIEHLTIPEYRLLRNKAQFIASFPDVKPKVADKLVLNGVKYRVCTDMSKITTAQYIDFQTYFKMEIKNYLKNILACFIIPEGKEYGDYDVQEVAETIGNNLSIVTAFEMVGFFQKAFLNLTLGTLHYLERQLKKAKITKKERKEIVNQIKQARLKISGVGLQQLTMLAKK